jgi:hypothetical protein
VGTADTTAICISRRLDRRQAADVEREKAILRRWPNDAFGNSIAIGSSAKPASTLDEARGVLSECGSRSSD